MLFLWTYILWMMSRYDHPWFLLLFCGISGSSCWATIIFFTKHYETLAAPELGEMAGIKIWDINEQVTSVTCSFSEWKMTTTLVLQQSILFSLILILSLTTRKDWEITQLATIHFKLLMLSMGIWKARRISNSWDEV